MTMFGIWGRNKHITRLLDEHAEGLRQGTNRGEAMLAAHPEDAGQLEGLFRLADRVAAALTPVEPSPEFKQNLKAALHRMQIGETQRRAAWNERRTRAMQVSRILGLIISILAIAALLARILSTIIRLIAFLADRNRRTPATA